MKTKRINATQQIETVEAKIETGLTDLIEVSRALLTVRDQKLYRSEFKTFEDYCRTKWGLSPRKTNQLLDMVSAPQKSTT